MTMLRIISIDCRALIITAYSGQYVGDQDQLAAEVIRRYSLLTEDKKQQCLQNSYYIPNKNDIPKLMKELGLSASRTHFDD